jgi:hypothetical protein
MLRVDPAQRQRLADIAENLRARVDEAHTNGWLGEVQGLRISLDAAHAKLAALDSRQNPTRPVNLGLPNIRDHQTES